MRRTQNRRASVLAIVMLACVIVGLLAFVVMNRSIQSGRVAAWSRDHLSLRLLAESAVEELDWRLQAKLNDPSSDLFR